jgi:hypothetical protein
MGKLRWRRGWSVLGICFLLAIAATGGSFLLEDDPSEPVRTLQHVRIGMNRNEVEEMLSRTSYKSKWVSGQQSLPWFRPRVTYALDLACSR